MRSHKTIPLSLRNNPLQKSFGRDYTDIAEFFETAVVPMHWVTSSGIIAWANKAELTMLGYKRNEYVGRNISDFHADPVIIRDLLKRIKMGKTLHDYEAKLRCRDGEIRDVLISSNVYWKGQKFLHTHCFTKDITDRKKANQRLSIQYEISKILSEGSSLEEVTEKILQVICNTLGWKVGAYWKHNVVNKKLTCVATWKQNQSNFLPFEEVSKNLVLKVGSGLPGKVIQEKKTIWIEDPTENKKLPRRKIAQKVGLYSAFGFPVIVGKDLPGVFEFFTDNIQKTDYQLLRMFSTMGNHIGQFVKRKEAEDDLKKSNERLELAQKVGKIGTFEWNLQTDEIFWSSQEEQLFGVNPGTFRQSFEDYIEKIHPDDVVCVRREIQQAIRRGKKLETEFRVIYPNKSVHWLSGSAKIFYDKDGKPLRMIGVNMDITKRKRSDEELRSSEERYRLVVENVSDMISLLDLEGNFFFISPAVKKILGYTPRDLLGRNVFSLIHPDDLTRVGRGLKNAIKGRIAKSYVRMRHKSGQWVTLEGAGKALFDLDNKPYIIVSTAHDVTDQKRIESRLRNSRDQLDIILQGVADGITVQDRAGNLIYVNEAAARTSGYKSAREMLKNPSAWLEKFELRDEEGKLFDLNKLPGRRALKGELNPEELINYRSLDGGQEWWALIKARPIFDETGHLQLIINIVHDITQRKEEEKRKDEFIGVASHELKTPLTSIKAFNQLLLKQFTHYNDEVPRQYLTKMETQINKLTELIGDLLDVSRIQAGRLEFEKGYFDMRKLIEETVDVIQHTSLEHKITIKGRKKLIVWANRDRIDQVLVNLLSNAIKYSSSSKKIIVNIFQKNGSAVVSVRDFGIGIAKENSEKIFDRFFRAHGSFVENYPGLGVGLYISKEIVKRHQGQIWVESAFNKGSTFYFSLPLKQSLSKKTENVDAKVVGQSTYNYLFSKQ